MPIAQTRDVAFILNDRPDLAAQTWRGRRAYRPGRCALRRGARGRGPDAIVGVTCHDSRHLAIEAAEAGADYVAFGAFFPTHDQRTEDARRYRTAAMVGGGDGGSRASPSAASRWRTQNRLIDAGADFLAVSCGRVESQARSGSRREGVQRAVSELRIARRGPTLLGPARSMLAHPAAMHIHLIDRSASSGHARKRGTACHGQDRRQRNQPGHHDRT